MINIFVNPRYKLDKKSISSRTIEILAHHKIGQHETINIAFIGKRKMKEIALQYKNEDVALPVLSFAYRPGDGPANAEEATFGEIVICYPQAVLLAAEKNKTVEHTIMALIEHGIENMVNK